MRRGEKRVNGDGLNRSDVQAAVLRILESCRRAGPVSTRQMRIGTSDLESGDRGPGFLAAVGMALREALEKGEWAAEDPAAQMRLSWFVLRAGAEPIEAERAWAVAVANDLGALPERLQRKWWVLLDANDHAVGGNGELGNHVERMLKGLPAGEFELRFAAWTRLLAEAESVDLGYGGVTLLNWLLRLAAVQREARLDASLYRIAQSNWAPMGVNWVGAYLKVLATRPWESASVCMEALSLHPATGRHPEVLALSESRVALI